QRVDQPLLGGLAPRAHRHRRHRAGLLRLRLPAPRRPRRPGGLAGGDRRPARGRRRADHVRQPPSAPRGMTHTAAGTDAPVEFDPFSPDYFDDPTETYRRLREEAPVYFSERYGFYALSRFEDVVTAHRDWKGLTSTHGVD